MRLNKLHLEGLLSDQELIRKNKVEHLRQTGRSPYTHKRWERSCNLQAFRDQYGSLSREELSQITKFFSCAGRIRLIRIMNKVIFLNIQDQSGQIQLYVRQDEVGSHPFSEAKNFDLGDIIGGKGRLMKTHKGELTIRLTKIVLLSKALKVLPEKFHGLKKVEQRFRHRYLDLIFNKKTLAVFRRRTLIIRLLQTYLDDLGFLEVETPVLQEIEGGANATPFKTRHKFLKSDLFLRIATEISLKKLVVGMIEKVYEIGKVFRNEGVDATHNPEFTSLELYSAYDNMEDGLDLCENIFANWSKHLKVTSVRWGNHDIDLSAKFKRISMVEAVENKLKIDFSQSMNSQELSKIIEKYEVEGTKFELENQGFVLNQLFEKYVQPDLIQPTFVYWYPLIISPLAKRHAASSDFTDRFELFINGHEIANGFAELNDPEEQKIRFQVQQQAKRQGGQNDYHNFDQSFIEALEYGLPPTFGLGIGIDRVVMMYCGEAAIREVILFPSLRAKK